VLRIIEPRPRCPPWAPAQHRRSPLCNNYQPATAIRRALSQRRVKFRPRSRAPAATDWGGAEVWVDVDMQKERELVTRCFPPAS
jgi:hypothetical protein